MNCLVLYATRQANPTTGQASGDGSPTKIPGTPTADASGRGSSHRLGDGSVSRRPASLCRRPPGGQLYRDDPVRAQQRQRQRLGKLSKEGNSLLRYLWIEATLHAVVKDPELKRFYRRKLVQKGMGKARVATARQLGIRLWIMLRDEIEYEEFCRRGKLPQKGKAHAGMPDYNSGPARAVTGSTE